MIDTQRAPRRINTVLDGLGVAHHVNPTCLETVEHGFAHVDIKADQRQRTAMNQRDLAAEAREDVGEFNADVTAAQHRDPMWQRF